MNKTKHPNNRAERLRLKYLKDTFDNKSGERATRKVRREALKAKELEDELSDEIARVGDPRIEVSGSQEKATISADPA